MQSCDKSSYSPTYINNICRICLMRKSKLLPIFDPNKPPHYSILIMACASVQVIEGDGLPPYICQKCISNLNIAFQFKTQCELSDAKVREYYEKYDDLPPTPDLISFVELSKDYNTENNNTNPLEQEHTDINVTENKNQMDPLIELKPETVLKVEEILEQPEVDLKVEEILEPPEHNLKMEEDLESTELDIQVEELPLTGCNQNVRKRRTQHQCDTCGDLFRTKSLLIRHIRTHAGERPYGCPLCGKLFNNGEDLHSHMRAHSGEKNHICVTCTLTFATAEELTKHAIKIHSLEEPNKIDTGDLCEHCGKTFTTKSELDRHLVVHTGQRPLLCEFCNRGFSHKANLITHLQTHKKQ